MANTSARRRAALASIGLGTVLALCPQVWAETPAANSATAPAPMLQQESFAPLVKKVLPAVVNISVTESGKASPMADEDEPSQGFRQSPFDEMLRKFFDQQGRNNPFDEEGPQGGGVKRIALGSGFIIDADGHIVTNRHVVGDSSKVEVTLQSGDKYTAKIVGKDARTDLAVLKIDAGKPLPYVNFGNSDGAEIGDWVVAVGNPFGLGGSVTTGIISARGRDIHTGQFDDFLQIDAPINRGNSGGPTFNLRGEVIGINTAIYSPNGGSVGIGFAVPSNSAKTVVAQLEEHGKVERGWLGVQIQEITPAIGSSLGLKSDHGALVAVVTPDSPGGAAGLKQGDVIVGFNGNEVSKMRDLPRFVSATAPGTKATLTVWRDGKESQVDVKLGEMPENPQVAAAGNEDQGQAQPSEDHVSTMGLHLAPLTRDVRSELHLGQSVRGVVITGVDNGSLADNLGLSRGDVIMSINQQPTNSPQEAADRLRDIAKSPNRTALLLLNRHGVTQYIGIELSKNQG
jgi:serine protease Do